MTPVNCTVGLGTGGRCYLSSKRQGRLGVYFWFRLFNVAPDTTARFFHQDDQRRDQSPPRDRGQSGRSDSVPSS